MAKLTKRQVDALRPKGSDYTLWDDELRGFGVRIRPSGRKTYIVKYRFGGRQRKFTIGAHGALTPDQARTQAMAILSDAKKGTDAAAKKSIERKAKTMKELGKRFLDEHVAHHCKPTTQYEYRRCVELFINPAMGNRKVSEITRPDVAGLHHDLRHTPYQANRVLGVLSKMFNLSEVWGLRPDGSNPCRHVKKNKEKKRERFLSPEELKQLGASLKEEELEAPSAVACIRLLILTGCRLSEIQKLKWAHVDLERKVINLPDSKTGQKTIYLGQAAIEQLKTIPRIQDNPYVITGLMPGQYLTDMQKPWRRIRARAGLEDVRIHDLRHTFASNGVMLGQGLPMVGKLLGHTQPQTTARYAHLAAEPSLAAADQISQNLAEALG